MSTAKTIWSISKEGGRTCYYTQITKVKSIVHLLVCAGFNELFDNETFNDWFQIWVKGDVRITIEKYLVNLSFDI